MISLNKILLNKSINDSDSNNSSNSFNNDENLFLKSMNHEMLTQAWYQLKNHPDMLTGGSNSTTIDIISEHWFIKVAEKLKNGTMKYPKARRSEIPKPSGKTGKRPLTITHPRIKVIERAILNALEPIFEGTYEWKPLTKQEFEEKLEEFTKSSKEQGDPTILYEFHKNFKTTKNKDDTLFFKRVIINEAIFNDRSFGFRKERSVHNALHTIKHWPKTITFAIDYDIKKAFDNVNKNRLKNLFNKVVKDPKFWTEIEKLLNAGYAIESLNMKSEVGVNQGSILSPFLLNIYLTELDNFVIGIRKKVSISKKGWKERGYGDPLAVNSYKKIMCTYNEKMVDTLKKAGSVKVFVRNKKKDLLEHYKKFGRIKGIDLENKRVEYVRYADDLLIGIVGPHSLAIFVQKEIDQFLKSNLKLEISRNEIIHRDQKPIKFLGHRIVLVNFHGKIKITTHKTQALLKLKNRMTQRLKQNDSIIQRSISYKINAENLKKIKKLMKNINLSKDQAIKLNASINAFQHLSREMKNILNFKDGVALKNFLEQMEFDNDPENPAFDRFIKNLEQKSLEDQHKAATNFVDQLIIIKGQSEFSSQEVGPKLKKALNEFYLKAENILKEIENTDINKKLELIKKKHTDKITKKSKERTPILFTKEEETIYRELAKELVILDNNIKNVRNISVRANIEEFVIKLRNKGIVHPYKDQACGCEKLLYTTEHEIIRYFNQVMHGTLTWFSGAENFNNVKSIVENILRKSCILTLKRKYKIDSITDTIKIFSEDVKATSMGIKAALITKEAVARYPSGFKLNTNLDYFSLENLLDNIYFRSHDQELSSQCAVLNCENKDIKIHHLKKLHKKIDIDGKTTLLDQNNIRVTGIAAYLTAINRKQLPLCKKHNLEFENNKFSELDQDFLASH